MSDLFTRLPIKRVPPTAVAVALRAVTTSDKAERIVTICRLFELPAPVRELRFTPARLWRFDCAWPDQMLAVEVHGGGFMGGKHVTGAGMIVDSEKGRAAVLLGWRVLVFTQDDVHERKAAWVAQVLRLALGTKDLQQLAEAVKRRWRPTKRKPRKVGAP